MIENTQINNIETRPSKIMWLVLFGVVVALGLVGYILKSDFFGFGDNAGESTYQAIFLSNGQVYFGSISKISEDYVVLKNIYYLQANDSLQGTNAQSQPFSLVKLGKELHGPTDTMYINKSQILFYEDLRDDSSVVKTIESNKENITN